MLKQPPKLGYVLLVAQGLFSVLLPRKALALATTPWRLGFENVGDLQAREWYVELTRVLGVGMLVAGLTGLAVNARRGEDASNDTETSGDDPGDEPIRVDID